LPRATDQCASSLPPGVYGGNDLYQLNVPGFPFVRKTFAGFKVFQKSINEEWEPEYGRMTARLGTNKLRINNQGIDTFAWDFIEPPTESIPESGANGTQIWFVAHGGIDAHPIHFHLLNVQVINRVDAAGVIKPPDPNEMGWKETVRMNPFENVILAVRPIKPTVPFKVPTSVRPLDVTQPPTGLLGSGYNKTTNPNPLWDFDWQYVWHCHILGHEENDMMRPLILRTKPFAPTNAVATADSPTSVNLTWRDASRNETKFIVERATNAAFTQNLSKFTTGPHNGTFVNPGGIGGTATYTDTTVTSGVTYYYRVSARNSASASAWVIAAPVTP